MPAKRTERTKQMNIHVAPSDHTRWLAAVADISSSKNRPNYSLTQFVTEACNAYYEFNGDVKGGRTLLARKLGARMNLYNDTLAILLFAILHVLLDLAYRKGPNETPVAYSVRRGQIMEGLLRTGQRKLALIERLQIERSQTLIDQYNEREERRRAEAEAAGREYKPRPLTAEFKLWLENIQRDANSAGFDDAEDAEA